MAVLEANGKPIPAAPDPQPASTPSETPREYLPIFSGGKTSRRCSVRVNRDPGTLSYVPTSPHRHHGTPLLNLEFLTANRPPTSPFEIRHHSAQQQQLTHNHWQCSTLHQQQTKGRRYSTNTQCTTRANRPELCNNKSHEINNKSQETNDNGISNGSITGTQLQNTITTDHTDGFTPIVCDSRQKYSQVTSRSYNNKKPKKP